MTLFRLIPVAAILLFLQLPVALADLGIILDCSDSMRGQKHTVAGIAAKLAMQIVAENERISLVGFSHTATAIHFDNGTTDTRKAATKWIDTLKPGGGTNYLAGLREVNLPKKSHVIFLSDGRHQTGPADEVLAYLEKHVARKYAIHAIAIGCKDAPDATELLTRMAAQTGGSYTRIDSSEALVRQFLNIAVQSGSYRAYTPATKTVQLNRVSGRLLAFAYDGDVRIDAADTSLARTHRAQLPGEDVHLLVAKLNGDATINLANEQGNFARLGSVYVSDLPVHRLIVTNPKPAYRPAANLKLALSFANSNGTRASIPQSGVHGLLEVLDAAGRVATSTAASIDGNQLRASLPLPSDEGTYKLRATSVWPRDGKPFSQTTESVVIVKKPTLVKMVVEQAELVGSYATKTFTEVIKVVSPKVENVDVKLTGGSAGIELAGVKQVGDKLSVTFTVTEHGIHAGRLKIMATTAEQDVVADVPFRFEVKSRSDVQRTVRVPTPLPASKPLFSVSKSELKLTVAVDQIVRFELLVEPDAAHTGATKLDTEFATFTTAGTPVKNVVASVRWVSSQTLRGKRGTVRIKGSILAPTARGEFKSTLIIRAQTGASIDIPVTLQVE